MQGMMAERSILANCTGSRNETDYKQSFNDNDDQSPPFDQTKMRPEDKLASTYTEDCALQATGPSKTIARDDSSWTASLLRHAPQRATAR